MDLTVDLPWLLEIARIQLGDPDVTDWGALEAARSRHAFHVMDEPVYAQSHHRAAALFHSLARVPALEHSNELFGVTVAAGYLHASGLPARFSAKEAADLAEQVSAGHVDVRALATALKEWTERR
ncbi:fic family toxin-antitoxin system, toxin component [Streptomyces sp. PSKA30]|uniref:fic family toxin-antitoxin system, toxin component n=1 Tax=Streptomyces sp. PSKA30 TaxID=2874597 RepID=UPI001CD14285|nr:fic family toxin-antitoxin system, toxin component [Streptomyces sp. PSKA30]MBZ9645348.1 fic family toxin-antitoxin system, toxin component [Streptomyces sp. PSKA30]